MRFAILDTNVVVSAMLSHLNQGHPASILQRLAFGEFVPIYSQAILEEYEEVLKRKKFSFRSDDIDYVLQLFRTHGICEHSVAPMQFSPQCSDPFDQPFYDLAHVTDALLVTGNIKHFPKEIRIITPADFNSNFFRK